MLKMKHLKKFIVKKYGLNGEEFLVEVIYKDEIIPEEYSVIDVAYLHNYRKVWFASLKSNNQRVRRYLRPAIVSNIGKKEWYSRTFGDPALIIIWRLIIFSLSELSFSYRSIIQR